MESTSLDLNLGEFIAMLNESVQHLLNSRYNGTYDLQQDINESIKALLEPLGLHYDGTIKDSVYANDVIQCDITTMNDENFKYVKTGMVLNIVFKSALQEGEGSLTVHGAKGILRKQCIAGLMNEVQTEIDKLTYTLIECNDLMKEYRAEYDRLG